MGSTDPSTRFTEKASGTLNTSLLETENRRKFGLERTQAFPLYQWISPAKAGLYNTFPGRCWRRFPLAATVWLPRKTMLTLAPRPCKLPLTSNLNTLLCPTTDTKNHLVSLHLLCTLTCRVSPSTETTPFAGGVLPEDLLRDPARASD